MDSMRVLEQQSPQREAAFFYSLFLRGHQVDRLRRDIDVPGDVFARWMRRRDCEAPFRANLQRLYDYRKQVLAIFNTLVDYQNHSTRLQ